MVSAAKTLRLLSDVRGLRTYAFLNSDKDVRFSRDVISVEEAVFVQIGGMSTRTEFFWTNKRGYRLHVRHFEHNSPRALLVLVHGYGAHMNLGGCVKLRCFFLSWAAAGRLGRSCREHRSIHTMYVCVFSARSIFCDKLCDRGEVLR